MRWVIVAVALVVAACHPGGEYVQADRAGGKVDRGDVNGRVLDFVSNKPENDDWTIRVRGTSLFVSHGEADTTDKLGSINLTEKEGRKVWRLIDKVDLPSRPKGKKDRDDGYVEMVLHEPSDDGPAKITTVFVARDNDIDDDVTNLAAYFVDLVKKYKNVAPPL